MARPKKGKPTHGDYYVHRITIGKKLDGTPIRKAFYSRQSKEEARRKAEEWQIAQQVAYMTDSAIDTGKTFADCAAMWLTVKKQTVKSNTFEFSYKNIVVNHLLPEFGTKMINSIQPYQVERFLIKKANVCSTSSLKKIKFCLSSIFEKAIQNNICTKNPVNNIENIKSAKTPKEKLTYSQEQLKLIYTFASGHKFGLGIIILMSEYGLRRGELLALKWEDVDFDNDVIKIQNAIAVSKKGNKLSVEVSKPKTAYSVREMPLSPLIKEMLLELPERSGYIIHTNVGTPYYPDTYSHRCHQVFMQDMHEHYMQQGIDIPMLTPHELRHTRASIWVNDNKNLFAIAAVMGWGDLKMLRKTYAHSNTKQLKNELFGE